MKTAAKKSEDTTEAEIDHLEFVDSGLENILDEPQVRRALDRLPPLPGVLKRPMEEQLLLRAVRALHEPAEDRDWHAFWSDGSRKTWRQLRNFSKRIHDFAAELKWVERSPFLRQHFDLRVRALAPQLDLYADFLQARIESLGKPRAEQPITGRNDPIVDLSLRVNAMTGRYLDDAVAELLDAVKVAMDGEQEPDFEFDAARIALFRSRWKKAHLKGKPAKT
jgi:hypothetical protein